ncbi:MAG: translation elongation factor 4, partial [bacterium]|nr:translation elongation factor 4 [bacterium]
DNLRSNQRESAKIEHIVLNLIDTPGHVDFYYEVSRSLAAVEGAILLVDGSQGIQAQTVANLHLAKKAGLTIIGAVNKVDLEIPNLDNVINEISHLLGVKLGEISKVSGKTGFGAKELLDRLIKEVPPPKVDCEKPFRALIFDSHFDSYKGVIAYVRVFEGRIKAGEKIYLMTKKAKAEALEVGVFRPQLEAAGELAAGEIGYIATGIKDAGLVRVGDTITLANLPVFPEALVGYQEPQPVVFASFYTENADDFDNFREALKKLKLTDAALTYEAEFSEALGRGFRLGFLGMLHLEIARERLKREYGLDLIITTPSVAYRVATKDKKTAVIYTPQGLPDPAQIESILEPWVRAKIILPPRYLNPVMTIVKGLRLGQKTVEQLGEQKMTINFESPLSDIIVDFYDRLKSVSMGYASMSYEIIGERPGDLVKLDILAAGEEVEAFSRIVPRQAALFEGRRLVGKLKEILPRQVFSVSLQAALGGKIIAREDIPAIRKDVTGYLYGGDYSRKRKLLEKQKRGKKKLKKFGRVEIPHRVFLEILKK